MSLFRHWPLAANLIIYAALMTVLILLAAGKTDGRFVYPTDDTYIHMAMAKNAAQHGVWGVTRYGFSSSTSSPLWTLLLTAAYSALWVDERFPLVMNLALSLALIFLMYVWLLRTVSKPVLIFIVLLVAALVAPLPALSLSGMEHVLHALLALSFLYCAAGALTEAEGGRYWPVLALAPLMTATRYEGAFAVAVVCGGFVLARKWRQAILLGFTGALPVVAYGLWSISHGWYFFPNSLLLKVGFPAELGPAMWRFIYELPITAVRQLGENPHIVLLMLAGLLSLIPVSRRNRRRDRQSAAVAVWLGMTLLHVLFARFGWFYRYEAYLVITGIIVVFPSLVSLFSESGRVPAIAGVVLLAALPFAFFSRAVTSLMISPVASKNIYEQQYQMGRFFREYYAGQVAAVNDIGAVSYLSDVRLVDLHGLGTVETLGLHRRRDFNTKTIARVSERAGVKVAIVYENWDRLPGMGGLPGNWEKVGEWSIPDNRICGGPTVAIHSVDGYSSSQLRRNLQAFSPSLPPDVMERGAYLSPDPHPR